MRIAIASRPVALTLVAAATAWWLFADTVRYHRPAMSESADVVRFCHWGGFPEYRMWRELIEAFHREHPDIRIRQEYIAGMGFGYSTKVRQQLIAGTAPDVILYQDEPFPAIADRVFADLTDWAADLESEARFHPTALDAFRTAGRVRGVPVFGGSLLIFCNRRAFRRAAEHHGRDIGLPVDDWTLEDFRKLARALTCDFDGDGRTDQYALILPGWIYQLPLIWAAGAEFVDETRTRWTLNDRAALDAFTFYQDLRFTDRVAPSAGDLGQMNRDVAFLTDRVALYITGPWFQPLLAETTLRDDYHIVAMPRGPAGRFTRITWDALCLNARCPPKRRPAALAFLRFACAGPGQHIIARQQRAIPALASAAQTFRDHARGGAEKFIDELAVARTQPITRGWHEMDRAIKRHLVDLMAEEGERVTPADFLRELADDPVIRRCFPGTSAP